MAPHDIKSLKKPFKKFMLVICCNSFPNILQKGYYNTYTLGVKLSKWLCLVRMNSTHQAMSKTGPLCPPTKGTSGFSLPTLAWGRMRKAPPPPDSTITATNFGLTAQNVESHELLDTLKTFNPMQNYKHHQIRSWFWKYLHLLNRFLFQVDK